MTRSLVKSDVKTGPVQRRIFQLQELRGGVENELTGYLKEKATSQIGPLPLDPPFRPHSTSHCTLSSDCLSSMALHLQVVLSFC